MHLIRHINPSGIFILVFTLSMVGVVLPAYGQDSSSESRYTREEIQGAVISFADSWAAQIFEAATEVAERAGTVEARRHTDRFRYYGATAAFDIASHPNPGVNLLDLMVLVSLNRIVWEEYWGPQVYGQAANPMIDVLRAMEREIWGFAGKVMAPNQLQEVREVMREWRAINPDKKGVHFIRFSDFGALGRKPTLEEAMQPGGLLAPVKEAAEAAEEIKILGDRALYLMVRMQELMIMRLELAMKELLQTPEFSQTLEDVSGFRESSERYADIMETLPNELSSRMQALLNQALQEVSVERQAAINQLLLGVREERELALDQAMEGVTQVRQETINHLINGIALERQGLHRHSEMLLQQAGVELKSVVMRLFVLGAVLMLLYFLLRIVYRHATDRPADTWYRQAMPAFLLLVVSVPLITATVLIYDHYPPIGETFTREPGLEVSVINHDDPDNQASVQSPASILQSEESSGTVNHKRTDGIEAKSGPDTRKSLSIDEAHSIDNAAITGLSSTREAEPASSFSMDVIAREEGNREASQETLRLSREVVALQVLFGQSSIEPAPEFDSSIEAIAEILLENPAYRAEIQGHSDSQGAASANQALSEARAMAVARRLTQRGIASDRFVVLGYGQDKPVASNQTVDGRAKNRRVEIRIIR